MISKDIQSVQSGERTNPDGKAVSNKILLSIPDDEYRSIRPYLQFVALPHHLVLHEPGEKPEFAYFMNGGMTSLVITMQDGRTVETGIVGNEGIVGIASVVGLSRSPLRWVIQIAGDGFKVNVSVLQNALQSTPQLQGVLTGQRSGPARFM
jgi:hypothetical protein